MDRFIFIFLSFKIKIANKQYKIFRGWIFSSSSFLTIYTKKQILDNVPCALIVALASTNIKELYAILQGFLLVLK